MEEQQANTNAAQPTPVQQNNTATIDPAMAAENKKAGTLCGVSLLCMFGAIGAPIVLLVLFAGAEEAGSALPTLASYSIAALTLYALLTLVAWVLEIIALATCRRAKIPKVVIWIYVGLVALKLIVVLLVVSFIKYLEANCRGF